MPRRSDLPLEFASRPFSVREALDDGVTAGRLAARDLVIPFRGVRDRPRHGAMTLVERCDRYAPRMKAWQFFSHETALVLRGAPAPRCPHLVGLHVAAHRPAREPRIDGVVGHRLQVREDASTDIGRLRVENVVRAWRQVAGVWRLDDVVAAADFIVGRGGLATLEELREEVCGMKGRRMPELLRALSLVRAGSASSEETRLRLVLARAGLPEPELNWPLRNPRGHVVAELDLAFVAWKIDVEYDGRQHAEDPAQYRRDVERRETLARLGWRNVQIVSHHLRGDGREAVAIVRHALRSAGWQG